MKLTTILAEVFELFELKALLNVEICFVATLCRSCEKFVACNIEATLCPRFSLIAGFGMNASPPLFA